MTAPLAHASAQAGTAPDPAAEREGFSFRPESTVQWVAVVGFLLILLRGARRH